MIGLGITREECRSYPDANLVMPRMVFLRIRDLLGYTVYTILVWLVGMGSVDIGIMGVLDELINRALT